MTDDDKLDKMAGNPLQEMADIIPADTPMNPAMGIAAMALGFSLKFHDAIIIKDGGMYQQFKLEGRNIKGLTLEDVFDTAKRIELHLLLSQRRIMEMMVQGVWEAIEAGDVDETALSPEPMAGAEEALDIDFPHGPTDAGGE